MDSSFSDNDYHLSYHPIVSIHWFLLLCFYRCGQNHLLNQCWQMWFHSIFPGVTNGCVREIMVAGLLGDRILFYLKFDTYTYFFVTRCHRHRIVPTTSSTCTTTAAEAGPRGAVGYLESPECPRPPRPSRCTTPARTPRALGPTHTPISLKLSICPVNSTLRQSPAHSLCLVNWRLLCLQ